MEQAIETVIGLLSKIKDVYAEMVAISEIKQQYIIKGNAQGLNEVVAGEWRLLKEVSELEESRLAAAASLQNQWGVNPLTISEMEIRAPQYKGRLKKVSTELKNTIAAQKKLNDQNMALLQLHFEYMNFVMTNFTQEPPGDIYGNSGSIMEAGLQSPGIFDSQA